MASTVFDSALFRDMFGTAEMRDVFSDEALVGRYLEAEAALGSVDAIRRHCDPANYLGLSGQMVDRVLGARMPRKEALA